MLRGRSDNGPVRRRGSRDGQGRHKLFLGSPAINRGGSAGSERKGSIPAIGILMRTTAIIPATRSRGGSVIAIVARRYSQPSAGMTLHGLHATRQRITARQFAAGNVRGLALGDPRRLPRGYLEQHSGDVRFTRHDTGRFKRPHERPKRGGRRLNSRQLNPVR